MRIFVDSRDLIDMFNEATPMPIGDLAEKLAECRHQLVMPFSLVSELIPSDNNSIVVLRRFTKLEEDFSLAFLQQAKLPDIEIRRAAEEFAMGKPFTGYDPYVGTFHELWGQRFDTDPIFRLDVERTIGMRKMSKQIELTLERADIYHWRYVEVERAVAILKNEQKAIVEDDPKTAFRNTVRRWLVRSGAQLPPESVHQFADTLRKNPRVAPGWRLYDEVFDQMAREKGYKPTVNDVWDLAHITMLPYVDAMTLDKHKVQLVKKAATRLRVFDKSINYDDRVKSKVLDLLAKVAC